MWRWMPIHCLGGCWALGTQRSTVTSVSACLDFLKLAQQATLEEIHEATQIPKKSLYIVLTRLQEGEESHNRVIKEGSRRRYTYRLALFNTIQQLNSLLNSENPDTASDRGGYSTKNDFPSDSQEVISDQIGTCGDLITFEPPSLEKVVEYSHETASNPGTARVSPIQQVFNTIQQESSNPDTASVPPIQQNPPIEAIAIQQGDQVEILDGQFLGKRVVVESIEDGVATVKGKTWAISRAFAIGRLRPLKRSGGET
jgi:hypothetical protein